MKTFQNFCLWTFVSISFLSTIINSQPLFDDDIVIFSDLHNVMKVDGLNSLIKNNEKLLKETQIKLNKEQKGQGPTGSVGSYVDLLHMYARGIFPNGNFFNCSNRKLKF